MVPCSFAPCLLVFRCREWCTEINAFSGVWIRGWVGAAGQPSAGQWAGTGEPCLSSWSWGGAGTFALGRQAGVSHLPVKAASAAQHFFSKNSVYSTERTPRHAALLQSRMLGNKSIPFNNAVRSVLVQSISLLRCVFIGSSPIFVYSILGPKHHSKFLLAIKVTMGKVNICLHNLL